MLSHARSAADDAPESTEPESEPYESNFTIKNLEWWCGGAGALREMHTSTNSLLLNQAATLTGVPGSLQLAIGEAREAVAQAANCTEHSLEFVLNASYDLAEHKQKSL